MDHRCFTRAVAINESELIEEDETLGVLYSKGVNWDHPELLDHCSNDEAYYVAFRRYYKDEWKSKLSELRIAYNEKERLADQEREALRKIQHEKQAKINKIYASIFKWSKLICKVVLFIVALPIIAALAVLVYKAAIWLYFAIGYVYWLWFVQNLSVTKDVIFGVVLALTVLATIYVTVSTGFLKDTLIKSCDFLGPPIGKFLSPIVWVFLKVCDGIAFVFNFLRMFYTSNCPGIKYPGEK